MANSVPDLRVLDYATASKELDLASELFHRINRIIPKNQELLTISPNCSVRDAIALMRLHRFSQVPVVDNGEVLGVFSFRSFAQGAADSTLDEWTRQKCAPGDLTVDEFIEHFEFARVTEEMSRVFDAIDRDNGVLVGSPDRLIGILTPMDFLRYLHLVACPFVMVSEIELALWALIRFSLSDEEIVQAGLRCLADAYAESKVPTKLEEMTFCDYQSMVSNGEMWCRFEKVFGSTRPRTSGKLKQVAAIRNDLFHFKREITKDDHEVLAGHRNWLLNKIKQADAQPKKEKPL